MTLLQSVARATRFPLLGLAALALIGCAAGNMKPRAPVEDRGFGMKRPTPVVVAPSPAGATPAADLPIKPQLNLENAGKPGYYTVRSGDTLIRVGLETGQNWRDLQRWNELDNADRIEVGQVLRVVPPGQDPAQTAARPVAVARAESRPLESRPLPNGSAPTAAGMATPPSASAGSAPMIIAPPVAPTPPPAPVPAAAPTSNDEDMSWTWPAQGSVVSGFDESRNKGLAIAGKAGDTVVAAADGRVVYAGSGLRGYGNLVIIKHNETYLTAYAHNQALVVREDQSVRRGQKIAEMGSTDAERVQLHFEIRRRGKPVDPARLLPAR
jgi:lipoprotein NlpD